MKKLVVSVSGGRTSMFMLWWIFNVWEDRHNYEILVVFANTGKEHEGTLFFVDECATEWGIDVVWVEAVPKEGGKGWGVTHKIVDYNTASRRGEPFEAMIAKLGIPCSEAPFCSDQLKRAAIESLCKSIGWSKKEYIVAIGYRADEPRRLKNKKKNRLYPLCHVFPVTKAWILDWWKHHAFNLDIHVDDGNCDNCWKKSFSVLRRNAIRKPKSFEWWQSMTDEHGILGKSNFYRGDKSPQDIIKMAQIEQDSIVQLDLGYYSDCQESCEVF